MRRLLVLTTVFLYTLIFPHEAKAIIILPAVILIPIAKIVALIMGGFSIPAITAGTLWSKLFKKSLKRTLLVILLILLTLAGVLVIILKIQNPDRPLF